jgi:hypothetical protein
MWRPGFVRGVESSVLGVLFDTYRTLRFEAARRARRVFPCPVTG